MNIRHVVTASAAALLSVVAPAHTPAQESEERQVTLVGCIQRESEFRRMHGPGASGPLGPGIGGRDEFVLTDAREATPGGTLASEAELACAMTGTGNAYEITGKREEELERFLGRRVELTGMQKEADIAVGTTGRTRPTGGFDPLGHDLRLYEVELTGFRELTVARRAEAEAITPAAPEIIEAPEVVAEAEVEADVEQPEVVAEAEVEAPEAIGTAGRELPPTASPLPLAGLIGLLSLVGAAGVRALRRK